MIHVRPYSELYHASLGWLNTRHHFSFSDYYDEDHVNWSTLRVFNDDEIAAESGFPFHHHDNMEIVTYILSGELTHQDSLGNRGVLKPGIVQRMSAGKGIMHAEFNASPKPLHLFQMWVLPEKRNIDASWEEKKIDLDSEKNEWKRIVARDPKGDELKINQKAAFHVLKLEKGKQVSFTPEYSHQYVVLAEGKGKLNGHEMGTRDAAQITGEKTITLSAQTPVHAVLWDLHA